MIFKNRTEYIGLILFDLMEITHFLGKYLFSLSIKLYILLFLIVFTGCIICIPIITEIQFPFGKSYKDNILIKTPFLSNGKK